MAVLQGRNGYLTIGGVSIPAFSWSIDAPRNLAAPLPVGNTWGTNFAEGLQSSRLVAQIDVREKATEVLATAFWAHWLTRSWSGGFDDTAAVTLIASDSAQAATLANAKAEAFVLTARPGQQVGLQVVFLAPGKPSLGDHTATSYASTVDSSPPLMFDKVSVGGLDNGPVYGLELSYANNHRPNKPLDGTKVVASWDAGVITCGLSLTMAAFRAAAVPFADGDALTIELAGAATRVLTLESVIPNDPNNRGANLDQVYRTWNCLVQGGTTNPPLRVTT